MSYCLPAHSPPDGICFCDTEHRQNWLLRTELPLFLTQVLNIHSHEPQTEDFNLSPIFFNEDKTTHQYQVRICRTSLQSNRSRELQVLWDTARIVGKFAACGT